jgi:hypothetical protein
MQQLQDWLLDPYYGLCTDLSMLLDNFFMSNVCSQLIQAFQAILVLCSHPRVSWCLLHWVLSSTLDQRHRSRLLWMFAWPPVLYLPQYGQNHQWHQLNTHRKELKPPQNTSSMVLPLCSPDALLLSLNKSSYLCTAHSIVTNKLLCIQKPPWKILIQIDCIRVETISHDLGMSFRSISVDVCIAELGS